MMELQGAPEEPSIEYIKQSIGNALDTLTSGDKFLLQVDVAERCIVHRLAEYIELFFPPPTWNVDCEYNKRWNGESYDPGQIEQQIRGNVTKVLRNTPEIQTIREHLDLDAKNATEISVFPDVIVHRRGQPTTLLIMEVKRSTNCGKWKVLFDKEKIIEYRRQFGYCYGLFLTISTGADYGKANQLEWFA